VLIVHGMLILAPFWLFCTALMLPEWEIPSFNGTHGTGLDCLIWGFLFWPSNAIFLVSPALAIARAFPRGRWFRIAFYAITTTWALVSGAFVVIGSGFFENPHPSPAFKTWVVAHVVITFAMLLPTWRSSRVSVPEPECPQFE
jgi:hypothetical protein